MEFYPECLATGIGSFPHQKTEPACDLVLSTIPEIPCWPQLSKRDFREQMEIQYSEGLPCIVLDESKERIYFDTSGDPTTELEEFYENIVAENLDHFKISQAFSSGLYTMKAKLSDGNFPAIRFVKSQVTGPLTFGLAIVDENKRSIYYNDVFRDVVTKGTIMKALWIIKEFRSLGKEQICFVDEPILSAFGSSTYVSVQRDDVVNLLKEVFDAIHKENVLVGSHCCGNTEWPILMDAGADIISFDAYEYGQTIGYYPQQIKSFLDRGGAIAWGIVPTSDKIEQETTDTLIKKLKDLIKHLASKGISEDILWERCLLTPSCGTGSLTIEKAERIFNTLHGLSKKLRQQ